MEKAILKSIEGGFRAFMPLERYPEYCFKCEYFCDPLFWQALGKAEGWTDIKYTIPKFQKIMPARFGYRNETQDMSEWEYRWHRFIDHLIQGKSPESFFEELLDNNKK